MRLTKRSPAKPRTTPRTPPRTNPSSTPRSTTRSDGEDRRRSIIAAASALFADQGFDTTTTRDIAARAKCNVAAIKYYFGDKAGLFACVMEHAIAQVLEGGAHFIPDPNADPRDALKAWITWVLRTGHRRSRAGGVSAKLTMHALASESRIATSLANRLGPPVREGILLLIDRLYDGKLNPALREHAFVFVFSLCSQFAHGGPVLEKMGIAVPDDPRDLDLLAERLTNFIIGGLDCLAQHGPPSSTSPLPSSSNQGVP